MALAEGPQGRQALAPVELAARRLDLVGQRVLVTAGGTREPLDPVRFLGNRSSGKQGVAIARALAMEPQLLLLDEPLAALDVSARQDVRRTLREHLSTFEGTRLLVTHDPIDAYALADGHPGTFDA